MGPLRLTKRKESTRGLDACAAFSRPELCAILMSLSAQEPIPKKCGTGL